MSVTETVSVSWFSRLQSSIKGIVFGAALFFLSFPLLFWNEGRAVRQYEALKEGAGIVVSIPADKVDSANESKLVHLSSSAKVNISAVDPLFNIGNDALRISRTVEMFQWIQKSESKTVKKLGGSEETVKTYSYAKEWSDSLVDSGDFVEAGHGNPAAFPFESEQFDAKEVSIGAFRLNASQIQRINEFKESMITDDYVIPDDFKGKAVIYNGGLYFSADPMNPVIGDVRVRFESVPSGLDISVVAMQVKDSFRPYTSKNGNSLSMLSIGTHDAKSMFASARSSAKMLTFIMRIIGLFMMFVGLKNILAPLTVIADVVPFIGSIIGVGTSLVAILLALPLTLLTIAIAWLVFRPVLSISIMVIAGVLAFVLWKKLRAKPVDKPAVA